MRSAFFLLLFIAFPACLMADESTSSIDVSGFTRLVAGYLSEENISFSGYQNELTLGENSLFALQVDAEINEHLSVTAQGLLHASQHRRDGLEWLYVTYQPSKAWQIKAGKLRTPFYLYSDVIDVGYAYPWIEPPQQLYDASLFDTFDGVSASYSLSNGLFSADIEGYYGQFDYRLFNASFAVDANVEQLRGVALSLNVDAITLRLSGHRGNAEVGLDDLVPLRNALRTAGYQDSADSLLNVAAVATHQIGISYEQLDYFVKAEAIRIHTGSVVLPNITSFYATYGYVFYPFTVHFTVGRSNASYDDPVHEIPVGLDPRLDGLRNAYHQVFASIPEDDLDSVKLGVRWDVATEWAFKAEYSHLQAGKGKRGYFTINSPEQLGSHANLYQLAVEWVF